MKACALLVGLVSIAALSGFARYQQPATPSPAAQPQAATVAPKPFNPSSFGGEKFITRSSRDSVLSFTFPAEVSEILVHGGQKVKKGDPLIRARDEDVRAQRDLAKIVADSDLEVQKAQYGVDLADVENQAQLELRKRNSATAIDVLRAEVTLKARKVDLAIAKHEHNQAVAQLTVRQAQLDRLTLCAPFDGRIDEVIVDIGQVKRETEPALRIVDIDPLWIDVPTPTSQTITLGLKPGDPAWVLLDLPGEGAPKVWSAKVIEVGAAADPASNTRRVRVELANPSEWPSGMTAWVRFTPPQGEWAARVVDPAKRAAAK